MENTKTVNDDLSSLTKKTEDDGSLWECELTSKNPETQKKFTSKSKRLVVLLGSFADFDSFEYLQLLMRSENVLYNPNLEILVIGIGTKISRDMICDYTVWHANI